MPSETIQPPIAQIESNKSFFQKIMEITVADPQIIEAFPEEARNLLIDWAVDKDDKTLVKALEWEASDEDQ